MARHERGGAAVRRRARGAPLRGGAERRQQQLEPRLVALAAADGVGARQLVLRQQQRAQRQLGHDARAEGLQRREVHRVGAADCARWTVG
eukprot:2222714-Prymnesium_polylepis.1